MSEHQEQQFSRIQNIQNQLDQIASSINQLQTQRASEEMESSDSVRPDPTPITSHDFSNIFCDDYVIMQISDPNDFVVEDVDSDSGSEHVFEDDLSVGECLLEALPQESQRVEDVSVGTCAMEPSTQESLHEY